MTDEDDTPLMHWGVVESRILGWLVPIVAWLGWLRMRAGRQPARARIERIERPDAPSAREGARPRRQRSEADIASRQGEETVEERTTGGSVLGPGRATAMRESGGRRPK